jgi:hypothetical protein
MAEKKTGELESEMAQAELDKGRWLNNKTIFENTWAENPNAPAIGALASTVGSDVQKLSLDEAKLREDFIKEQERERLMKKKPPEGGCDSGVNFSGSADSSDLHDSPLQATPFRHKPK